MPFKTKRHKQSAASRRVNFIEGGLVSYRREAPSEKVRLEEKSKNRKSNAFSFEESYDYVRLELVKITILAAIIIGLQLALKLANFKFF